MTSYPSEIFVPRERENKDGVEYDPEELTVGYAEDFNYTDDEVVAIEEDLKNYVRKRIVELKIFDDETELSVGDGKLSFFIPSEMDGYTLINAQACVSTASSSGLPTIQIYNVTNAVDVLTTEITIDATEKTSFTASTPSVIDEDEDEVATGDELRIDVDVAGTGAKGLCVLLTFERI